MQTLGKSPNNKGYKPENMLLIVKISVIEKPRLMLDAY